VFDLFSGEDTSSRLFHLFNKGYKKGGKVIHNPCYRLFEFRCQLVPLINAEHYNIPSSKNYENNDNEMITKNEVTTKDNINNQNDEVITESNDNEMITENEVTTENNLNSQNEVTTENNINNENEVIIENNINNENEVIIENNINNENEVSIKNNNVNNQNYEVTTENNINDELATENNEKDKNKMTSEKNEYDQKDMTEYNENKQCKYILNDIKTHDFEITIKKFDKKEVDYKYLIYVRKKCNIQEGKFNVYLLFFLF